MPQVKQSAPHLQALFKAKERAHEDTRSLHPLPSVDGNTSQPPYAEKTEKPSGEAEGGLQEHAAPHPETTATTTASLLAHKKALRKKPK